MRIEKAPPSLRAQRGGALLIVLWTALLLSALMAGAIAGARIEARIAAAKREFFKAEQAILSALDLAAWRIAASDAGPNSSPVVNELNMNGYVVVVTLSEESQKLDVNKAGETAWAALLSEAGVGPGHAAKLAARIADWRDADDLPRPNGAEAPAYQVSNGFIGNRPFQSIHEIKHVLGMPPGLADCLVPKLSLFSDEGRPLTEAPSPARRGARAGAGRLIVIEAKAISPHGVTRAERMGVFRITGNRDGVYEWVGIFKPAPPSPPCDLRSADR